MRRSTGLEVLPISAQDGVGLEPLVETIAGHLRQPPMMEAAYPG
jgi:hypothetical protein